MKMKYMLFLLAFVACKNPAVAQQMSPQTPLPLSLLQVTPTSPEASTLIRNIQYPVNYGHGSVDITIPLYEITMGDVTTPITLSYNHKGLRTNEFTPYLGQGWSLNAEPAISRKVNGKPDINCQYNRPSVPVAENDWYLREALSNVGRNEDAFPDEYFYRLSGKSGEFIFKENTPAGGIATIPYDQIKVDYASNTFTITDDNGVIYEFGVSEESKVFLNNTNDHMYKPFPSIWKCTKISHLNDAMTFSYQSGPECPYTLLTETMIIEDEIYQGSSGSSRINSMPLVQRYNPYSLNSFLYYFFINIGRDYPEDNLTFEAFYDRPAVSSSNGTEVTRHYNLPSTKISKIDFPGGYVRFNISSKRLSTIEVYAVPPGGTTTKVRTISLEHGSTSDGYPMLDAVTVTGAGVDEKYTLAYNYPNSNGHSNLKSGHGNTAAQTGSPVNFWGYWIGETYTRDHYHIQSQNFNVNYHRQGNNKFETDKYFVLGTTPYRTHPASTIGMLKSIKTKSGAVTEFEYESDLFENTTRINAVTIQTADMRSGGLRIKTIKQSDYIHSSPIEKHFEYSKGISKVPITTDYYTTTRTIRKVDMPSGTWRQRIMGASLHGDITFSGTPIVYETVTEIIKGTENGVQKIYGKNVYSYNNRLLTPNYFEDVKWPYDDKENDWSRGQLDKVETFKYNASGSYTKVKEVEYFHTILDKDEIRAGEVFVTEVVVGGSGSTYDRDKIVYRDHPMKTGVLKLQRIVETLYDNNGNPSTSNQTAYSYHSEKNDHAYPIAIEKTNSDGRVYRQEMKYTQDVTGRKDQPHIATMRDKNNMLNLVLEQAEKTNGVLTNTTYNYYGAFWLSSSVSGVLLLQSVAVQSGTAAPEERIVYNRYGTNGKPVYVTKDKVTNVMYLWETGGQLVATIENADYTAVMLTLRNYSSTPEGGMSSTSSNFDAAMNALRSLENARVTSYKYKPLIGIAEITGPNGAKTTYEYDAKGRLATIKDDKDSTTNSYSYGLYNN